MLPPFGLRLPRPFLSFNLLFAFSSRHRRIESFIPFCQTTRPITRCVIDGAARLGGEPDTPAEVAWVLWAPLLRCSAGGAEQPEGRWGAGAGRGKRTLGAGSRRLQCGSRILQDGSEGESRGEFT